MPTLLSDDGEVAYLYFTFNMGKDGWNKIKDPVDEIKDITAMDGVDVYVGGFGGQAYDFISSFDGSHVTLLVMTFAVVILILLLTYRSAVLWILPILSAGVANVAAGGVVYLMAKYAGLVVNDQSQYILSILVIGAGTDYALLLVARYREELRRHEDRHEAMAFALHRAAPAIIASAATVVVGLMCLSFADLNSTASLGPVLAVGVAVTLLVMVTFLPALLVICGRWVFGPPKEHHRSWVKVGIGMIVGGIVAVALGIALGDAGVALLVLGALSAFIGVLVLVQVAIEHWTKVHSRPDFGSTEPTQTGLWARVGDRIKVRPRAGVGRHGGRAARRLPGPVQAGRQRPVDRGQLHRDARLGHGPEAARRPRPGRQLQHHPGRDQRRQLSGVAGCGRWHRAASVRPRTPPPSVTVAATSRSRSSSTWPRRRPSTSSSRRATRCTPSTVRMPWSAVGRRSTSTPRPRPSATTRWSSRWC